MTSDFGIGRERLIAKSGVRSVFTPHQPVQSIDLFFGRQREVKKLIEHINTPGQHALLYGDRGVGKSSLANIAASVFLTTFMGGVLYEKRCDTSDSFPTIVAKPLAAVGLDVSVTSLQRGRTARGNAGFSIAGFSAGVGADRQVAETAGGPGLAALSPSWVAEVLEKHRGLLLVDEADALTNGNDKQKLAELIKHLSDRGSVFKVLIVGIAETGQFLTGGHPSVHRCLKETRLDRMSDVELREIIAGGAAKLRLNFDRVVTDRIVRLSAGYPHFAQLLALKCAEEAIADGRVNVSRIDLDRAQESAMEDAEGTLKRTYDDAVRSYQTEMYRVVVGAAAECTAPEFKAAELRRSIKTHYNIDITQQGLNNYLQKLVSDSDATIIRRVAKGIYRFNDPRMPSYVKIAEGRV